MRIYAFISCNCKQTNRLVWYVHESIIWIKLFSLVKSNNYRKIDATNKSKPLLDVITNIAISYKSMILTMDLKKNDYFVLFLLNSVIDIGWHYAQMRYESRKIQRDDQIHKSNWQC